MGRIRFLVVALAACADVGDEHVGPDVEHLTAAVTCVPLEGARVLGTSPNGELWLATASQTRVLAVDGTRVEGSHARGLADASLVQPWSATTASVILDGEVWTVTEGIRELVATPPELGSARDLCGPADADHGTFIATDTLLERAGDLWWKWAPSAAMGFASPAELARVDGACTGHDGAAWLRTTAGAVWRITRDRVEDTGRRAEALAIVDGDGVAARDGGQLAIGPAWREVTFAAGDVATIASSGSRLWTIAGGGVFLRDAGEWRTVDGIAAEPIRIHADAAGGAWIEHADQVCRAQITPAIRITGLAPFEHRVANQTALEIVPPAGTPQVTIARDGTPIAELAVADGVALAADVPLGDAGWHALTIRAGETVRELAYELVEIATRSWATDIAPLASQRCGSCHGPGDPQIDLSGYDAWRTHAGRIRDRLVRGEMPPNKPLTASELAIVIEWIEGGTQP